MPVYQIYFPEQLSNDIVELSGKDGMNIREWVRKVVGDHISKRKKAKKTVVEDQE